MADADSTALPAVFSDAGEPSQFVGRMKRRATKSFSWTRSRPLEDGMYLAYWLHVFGREAEAEEVCRFLNQATFTGNRVLWGWTEATLALEARYLRRREAGADADRLLERVRAAGILPSRLDGVALESQQRNVEAVIAEGPPTRERDWRALMLTEQCLVAEMRRFASQDADEVEEQFEANLERLRELVGAPPTGP